MTTLPDIYSMDPDEWYDEVQRRADELKTEVRRALDETETLEALRDALEPHFQPYLVDPDEPVHAEQILAEIKYGEKLCVGNKNGDWMPLTYRRDEGYWWFDGGEARRGDGSVDDLHEHIARRVVESTNWGDPDLARQRADEQKKHRRIGEPYLQALEEAMESGEVVAADLREDLHRLVNECLESGSEVVVADVSPDDHHTQVRLRYDGEAFGQLLAVDPGAPTDLEEVAGAFELDETERQMPGCVTDHRHFRWPRMPEARGAVTLVMPSQKEEDVAEYREAVDWMVRNLREVLAPPADGEE